MARSGFIAVRNAKKAFDQQQKAFEGMRARDMRLIGDGDEAVIYFIGCEPDEPREDRVHTVTGVRKGYKGKTSFDVELCAHGNDDHDGCVYCHTAAKGDKRVKRSSTNYYFSIADSRWVHKEKNAQRSKEAGRDVFDWNDCPRTDDNTKAPCKLCKRKVPRERGGRKKLRVGMTSAIVIDNLNNSLKKRCQNCNGKITISGYKNGAKRRDDIEDLDESQRKKWEPEYECSKCDDPSPGSIFACPIVMRRNGTGQTTTYTFEKIDDFGDHPDWVQELEPFDWDKTNVPRSADNMAQQLGVDNPFDSAGKKKSKNRRDEADDYDDEDEETDDEDDDDDDDDEDGESPFDDDDDDDEEDEKPRKSKKAKRRREEDEDEDDEDDDEEDEEEDEDD